MRGRPGNFECYARICVICVHLTIHMGARLGGSYHDGPRVRVNDVIEGGGRE